ncbi:hypothetical protein HK098_006560 [Nowakowskiella sp. JEL0407]|nr:hypothetical protein HK098_006560 [Nowakowskiella sp. JEL0407]
MSPKTSVKQVNAPCAICGSYSLKEITTKQKFELFFVPLFTMSKSPPQIVCENCSLLNGGGVGMPYPGVPGGVFYGQPMNQNFPGPTTPVMVANHGVKGLEKICGGCGMGVHMDYAFCPRCGSRC